MKTFGLRNRNGENTITYRFSRQSREIELTIARDKLATQEAATRQLSDAVRRDAQEQVSSGARLHHFRFTCGTLVFTSGC